MVAEAILREEWGFGPFYEVGTQTGFLYDPPILDSAAGPTIYRIIRLLQDNPSIMDEYLMRVARFRQRLLDCGYRLNSTPSYITSIMIGSDAKAVAVRESFLAANMTVPVFRYPAVKPNQALMRVILNRSHSDEHIDAFIETLGRIRRTVQF